jgi:hypothetical protein
MGSIRSLTMADAARSPDPPGTQEDSPFFGQGGADFSRAPGGNKDGFGVKVFIVDDVAIKGIIDNLRPGSSITFSQRSGQNGLGWQGNGDTD